MRALPDLWQKVAPAHHAAFWKRMAFDTGYATILNVAEVEHADSPNWVCTMGPSNIEVTSWLKSRRVDALVRTCEPRRLATYAELLASDAVPTCDALANALEGMMPNGLEHIENEAHFGGYAIHLLHAPQVTSLFAAVYSEIAKKLKVAGDTSKRSDGIVIVKANARDQHRLYLIELKWKKTAAIALNQITEKEYVKRCLAWLHDRRKDDCKYVDVQSISDIHLLGINGEYSTATNTTTVTVSHERWSDALLSAAKDLLAD
eukprot:m.156000 g.156000  ORF g.156000 m.156000 type:complete len:261 (+) comp14425_c0_seq1:2028-2810(+)